MAEEVPVTDHPHHAADDGPSGIATCSVPGAQLDPATLWLRAACRRLGRVTVSVTTAAMFVAAVAMFL